jgi:TIR domain
MTRVFISYSNQDREFAQWVKSALTKAGITTNLDEVESSSTADFASAIRQAVQAADALLAILSDDSTSSNFVMLEIGMAQGLGKKVVVIAAPGAKPDLDLLKSLADGYVLDAARLKQPELGAQLRKLLQGEPMGDTSASA